MIPHPECPDDDEQEVEQDCLETRMRILRDVMLAYDWTYLMDVRDRLYTDRLGEALAFLGMSVHSEVPMPEHAPGGYRCNASLTIYYGEESERHTTSATSDDRELCAIMAGRAVFRDAGLIGGPSPLESDGGWSFDLPRRR